MNDNINRADVMVNLKDVHGHTINDEVEITFYNQKMHSLSQTFTVKFKGAPVVLPGVPAFPTGQAEVFIKPNKYRYKSIFINVVGGEPNSINEDFFVDPDKARPKLMDFKDLAAKLYGNKLLNILQASNINQAKWDALDKRIRATILNLSAKLLKEATKNGQSLIDSIDSIDQTWLDKKHRERIFSLVHNSLLSELRSFPERYQGVPGGLHHFPPGWTAIGQGNSFKTQDAAGNLQLTFATKAEEVFLADLDLDDHKGLKHASDVLKHKITGKDTDPYDIHEILIYFQNLDPGYYLL